MSFLHCQHIENSITEFRVITEWSILLKCSNIPNNNWVSPILVFRSKLDVFFRILQLLEEVFPVFVLFFLWWREFAHILFVRCWLFGLLCFRSVLVRRHHRWLFFVQFKFVFMKIIYVNSKIDITAIILVANLIIYEFKSVFLSIW